MSMHGLDHEALIRAIVVGERSHDDSEVARRRTECAVCAADLDRLASVAARLDEEAREELAILALAETVRDAPGVDRIEAFRAHPEFRRGRRSGVRRTWWAAAAGIAATVLVGVVLWQQLADERTLDPGGRGDRTLGDELVTLQAFDGFDDGLVLSWEPATTIQQDVAKWEIVIVSADDDAFIHTIPCFETTWSDPTAVHEFPERITVTVRALTATGVELGRSDEVTGLRAR
jgi:hypothetical protein